MKTGKERKVSFTQKLLVEGKNDQHVIWALCDKFDVHESFDIIDCGGKDQLLEQLPVQLKASSIETLGVILDADLDLPVRWAELKGRLSPFAKDIPEELPSDGWIADITNVARIGVWMMPNNQLTGSLEDFIAFLIPDDDLLAPIVNATLDAVEQRSLNKYPLHHRSKAFIHNWLSMQETPGTPLGQSITKRYLTTDRETCQKLMNWVQQLFNSEA